MKNNAPIKFVSSAAGFPSPADDFAQHSLDLNKYLIKNPAASFFMRNEASENKVYGIELGDILLVDRSLKPSSQRLCVVSSDEAFQVRRYLQLSSYKTELEFWGVIVSIIRRL